MKTNKPIISSKIVDVQIIGGYFNINYVCQQLYTICMLEIGINQITNLCRRKEIIGSYRFNVFKTMKQYVFCGSFLFSHRLKFSKH